MESDSVSDGSGGMHQLSEVRLVLLGVKASGKSSTGNTIMGAERFKLQESSECVKRKGKVAGREITVVEAPGWTRNKAIKELAKQEIVLSVAMCSPGPHAVLLVMRLDNKSWLCEKNAFRACMKLLPEFVWSHSIVAFTFGDSLGDTSIEQYIERGGRALQWLVEKCGNRYHVFNNKNNSDSNNVMEFLEKIEKMVAENQGGYLEMDRQIISEVTRKKFREASAAERKEWVSRHRRIVRSKYVKDRHLSEVRIVLLGFRNSGKSSARSTILGTDISDFCQDICLKKMNVVAGRLITVVEAPGWQRHTETLKIGLLKKETMRSVSMCSPGPHAVLLVVSLEVKFTEKRRNDLVRYLESLGTEVWNYVMILFTFGDSLGDTTVERHIESEGFALQWLVEKCRDRYHVFNNKKRDETQVIELLLKIEEMVAENGGHCYERSKEDSNSGMRMVFQSADIRRFFSRVKRTESWPRIQFPEHGSFVPMTSRIHSSFYNQSAATASSTFDPDDWISPDIRPVSAVRAQWSYKMSVDDGNENKYRFSCSHACQFMCQSTDLVFDMKGKGAVTYRIVSWSNCSLDGLGQVKPAGPLYSITCSENSVHYLHLRTADPDSGAGHMTPALTTSNSTVVVNIRCSICSSYTLQNQSKPGTDVVTLSVAHVTGGNVEIIQSRKVTDTHVIIQIQGLSLLGVLYSMIFPELPIKSQVLLFYNKWIRKLHIHLLPANIPAEEVQKKEESYMYMKTSSKCELIPNKTYRPCCETSDCTSTVQPEAETFDRDFNCNYHPTFEVLFDSEANKVTLSLLDENGQVVWKPRMVLLSGTARVSSTMESTGARFVDHHRAALIERVISVMLIADSLFSKEMITYDMYSKIQTAGTMQAKMRLLYQSLDSGGRVPKAEFYEILRKNEAYLVEELEKESA